ncbi:DUF262 domain-containing protein [Clostridium folliculivorans]|uniref:DUF262 domain-containing protein n=1 Tax=Clostridium folliculivorans TaxID=2886038 RepID=UPI0021C29D52|nr:DUF262 domain-containing protein [Clostridium folliculivorans]GKU30438.1 hypothetical protein CFB3_25450 [Clostridium folliculivorans]
MGRIKTEDRTIESLLHENSMIFEIPVNQRKYSWGKDQIQQYWDDISSIIGSDGVKHYLGVITLIESKKDLCDSIKIYEVIDGQQRMITTILFISALRDFFLALKSEFEAKQIQKDYLVSSTTKMCSNKLKSCKIDTFTFDSIVNINLGEGKKIELKEDKNIKPEKDMYRKIDTSDEEYINENIIYTYKFFYNNIVKTYKERTTDEKKNEYLGDLEDGLGKLDIITVISDSPESMFLYFDSLNNRGLQLSQMDIVRNTFFKVISKKFNKEITIYSDLWDDLILKLDDLDAIKFLKYYCMSVDQVIYSAKELPDVYEKKFTNIDTSDDLKIELRKMIDYAKIYSGLFCKNQFIEGDCDYIKSIVGINRLGQQACHSFIMDYLYNIKDNKRRLWIICAIENMMFRRIVCCSSTKKLDGIFRDLIKSKTKIMTEYFYDDNRILSIIKKNTPTDDEFEACIVNKKWENNNITMYIMVKIEEKLSNRFVENLKNNYIDHISSFEVLYNCSKEYSEDELVKMTSSIGNLVLLEFEPKDGSDRLDYISKVIEGYYDESKLANVNDLKISYNNWDVDNIKSRTSHFAKMALDIWNIGD